MHSEAQHDPIPRTARAALPRIPAAVWFAVVAGTALLALVIVAATNASRCDGRPFPSLFVDPFGSYSAISWPTWQSPTTVLRFPDKLVAIEGGRFPRPGSSDAPAHELAQRLARLYTGGATEVALTFSTVQGDVIVTRLLRTLGMEERVFFFYLYAVVGLFVLWSGLAVLFLAGRRTGAVAYAWWTVGTFGFLVTFYDYHTTAHLVPVFSVSIVWVQICLVWLAYGFPEPPRRYRRALKRAALVFTGLQATAAVVLLAGPPLRVDVTPVRVLVAYTALSSLVVLVIAILFKLRTRLMRRRKELMSASFGLIVVPAFLAVGFALLSMTGTGVVHLLLPFLAALLPLSIGYALIQHNILATTVVLTRRMFVVPSVTAATAVGLMVWLAMLALVRRGAVTDDKPALVAAATMVALSVLTYRLSGRVFFRATAKFRPTIQQLADQLASRQDVTEIRGAIEGAVLRWLPTGSARVLLAEQLHQISHRPGGYRERLAAGETVWTTEGTWRRHLIVPMRSRGELRGVLLLAPKYQAALYTREDLKLLETIASLGAVALHNADVIAEVEALRRVEVEAARDEKRLALGLLGAEISHEIAYPLNFLRYLMLQGQDGRPLDARDFEIGREEIGRLERMFTTLRKLKFPLPRFEPVLLLPRARRALDLIRENIHRGGIKVVVEIPADLTVEAEPDALVQIFANLLRNAAQAVGVGQSIGIRAGVTVEGGTVIEVWDNGPGVSEAMASAIFSPFVTSKEGSMGLGLAVTHRLVRRFGWSISAHRQNREMTFTIEVPPRNARSRHRES